MNPSDHDSANKIASTASVFVQLAFEMSNVIEARHGDIGPVMLSAVCTN